MNLSKIRRTALRIGAVIFSFVVAVQAHAVHVGADVPGQSHPPIPLSRQARLPFDNPLRARSIMELLQTFLEGLIYIGTIALLLALVWCGFLFVKAQGAAEGLKDARRTLMWTLIGGLILIGAQGIAMMIEATGSRL